MGKNYLKSSLQNASFNIVFQVLFRCVTFILNAFVLRHVSQAVVGVMNVRLLLLESTILFLSREAFRRACLSKTSEHNWPQVINLLWLMVPLCSILSVFFGYIWLYVLVAPSTSITEHYTLGVWAICVSCIIEMFCEPLYLAAQAFLFVRLKVVMDTIYILVRTFTFVPLILYQPNEAVVAFSVAQILAALVYLCGYYIYFYFYIKNLRNESGKVKDGTSSLSPNKPSKPNYDRRESIDFEEEFPFSSLADFLPSRIENEPPVNYSLVNLTWSFFKQGILKQILTEGERYVMTLFSVLTFYEQGVYDIVNNLGSLAARFIFRPIEDSAYFYFSQMITRDTPIKEQNPKHISESANVLYQLLRCICCIGLVILTFGLSYSKLLLFLYGGEKLIDGPGPLLMRVHCLAVLLLAVNGITECYANATMNTAQLDRFNYLMAILSVSFLCISWVFTTLMGGVGFILANCCNMSARILHSMWFIHLRYKDTDYKPWNGLLPGPYFLVTLFVAGCITAISDIYLFDRHKFIHLLIGGFTFITVLGAWAYEEKTLVSLAVQKFRAKSKKKD
ncbi:man(5)GlcNAc(2)-PP-dolichol translocation protein RFT1 [Anabrus simplex]|uniref:man(5)GlcNAc(2)-PP-dolichol translocation protein RFT1 n=1 Tax=Anabrus simplex TaxID=316456 RepID=UPI0035A29E69